MKKLLLTFGLAALTLASAHAQGTIQLNNSVGTPIRIDNGDCVFSSADRLAGIADQLTVEVWWGTGAELQLGGTAGVGANGLITGNSLSVFQVAGSEAGATVHMQIRMFNAAGLRGETKVATGVVLGPTAGPGTVIWQGASGTNPNRFTMLIVPEPSTLALGGLAGALLLLRARKKSTNN
jgi:hypothetical protein